MGKNITPSRKLSAVDVIIASMPKVKENLIAFKKEKGTTLVVARNNKILYIKP